MPKQRESPERLRERAARMRELGLTITDDEARRRLEQYAAELEAQAAALKRKSSC